MTPTEFRDRKRVMVVAVGIFGLFALLVIQFFRLQIEQGDKWEREAQAQHEIIVPEPFRRGTFYSNISIKQGNPEQAQPLAIDVRKFHLYVDPASIPEEKRDEICKALLGILDLPEAERTLFRAQFDKKSRSRKLAMWLNKDSQDKVKEWWEPYANQRKIARNAIYFVADMQRSYPFGKLLGQVLHTIRLTKDEETQQSVPTGGMELYFDSYLRGKAGKRKIVRALHSPLDTGVVLEPPQHGADIYLTVNHYIQAIAEEELAKGVQAVNAKGGYAVMMDPQTGEILAMAEYPFFDPTHYADYFNDPEKMEATRVHAVSDAGEPGSVMKPLTMAIGLTANNLLKSRGRPPLYDPEAMMAAAPTMMPGRPKILKDTTDRKFLNMDMAIQKSSNVYVGKVAYQIVSVLGTKWYRSALVDMFGFSKPTHIELPGESLGLVPTPGKNHPNGRPEWSGPTPYALAMGHSIQASSLQVVRAWAVLANGGYLVEPTLVRQIVKTEADGTRTILLDNTRPERRAAFPRVLQKTVVDRLLRAIKFSTKEGGTAPLADIPGYTECGKTGTAEKVINGVYDGRRHTSTFIGITPTRNSRFVLLVTIDDPEYKYVVGLGRQQRGGKCAGPVFREIAKRTLEYLGVTPDDPAGYPVGDPRYDPKRADWVPETAALQKIYLQWNNPSEVAKKP